MQYQVNSRCPRVVRSLVVAGLLAQSAFFAFATDTRSHAIADHVGRLNGWKLLPEVVLKHCVIHVPAKAEDARNAFAQWRLNNAEMLTEIGTVVDASALFLSPMLRMTVEQTKEWQRDASTLVIEEVSFWRKSRIEIHSLCANYDKLLEDHQSERVKGQFATHCLSSRSVASSHRTDEKRLSPIQRDQSCATLGLFRECP